MSIFPKRSVPGSTVTIHWNFNTAHLQNVHVCPWVRIGVKDPLGQITMLFEDHVLGLPDPEDDLSEGASPPLKYLNKNLPLMVIADYLSGRHKREKLVEILENIQSGRHYYFTYPVPEEAPLGKYTLISEVHSGGEIKYSKTAPDDYFLIEKISLQDVKELEGKKYAVIENHSPEKTPVKIVDCTPASPGRLATSVSVFEMAPFEKKTITLSASISFLLYNEERRLIPLTGSSSPFLLRNQQILEWTKSDGHIYLLKKDKDEAFQLTGPGKTLWQRSDGLFNKDELNDDELRVYEVLKSQELIEEIRYSSNLQHDLGSD
ncbi:MAG: hypothetical protein KDC47_11030 [Flavobacteriaceae bacterium]|nr:hypothetical protein [Flavobacteriaceae bacterium]MCB0629980.1 hypothetical protein [Lewinella sp.]